MGALRIKSPRELQALKENKQIGNRAASLIEKELAKVQSKAKTLGSTQPGRKILPNSPHTNVSPFCPVPPIEPADRLYQALVRRWGRYYSGGEVVWELQPFDDSGYRLDAALVNYDWPGDGWLAIPWENAFWVQKGQKKTASVLPARLVAVQSFKRTSQRRA